jgi:hypothetical protein
LLLDVVLDDGQRRAADAGEEAAPTPENWFLELGAQLLRDFLRRSQLVTVLKLLATTLGAHFGFRWPSGKWTWSFHPAHLDALRLRGPRTACSDVLHSLEHCSVEALASVHRDEDERTTK